MSCLAISYFIFNYNINLKHNYAFLISYFVFTINMLSFLSIMYYHFIRKKMIEESNITNNITTYHCCRFTTYRFLITKSGMIFPGITHFADTASDIGVLFEFYFHDDDSSDIDYDNLFYVTLLVLFLYRFLSCLIIYNFSRSICDALLQFFDLYILKAIRLNIKLDYDIASPVQKYIQYLEALLELRLF